MRGHKGSLGGGSLARRPEVEEPAVSEARAEPRLQLLPKVSAASAERLGRSRDRGTSPRVRGAKQGEPSVEKWSACLVHDLSPPGLIPPPSKKLEKMTPIFRTGKRAWPFVPCPPACLGFRVMPSAELASRVGLWSNLSSEQST